MRMRSLFSIIAIGFAVPTFAQQTNARCMPATLAPAIVPVGTRSRLIRISASDGDLWCSTSDRIRVPARPA
jgi:hypothetical protein